VKNGPADPEDDTLAMADTLIFHRFPCMAHSSQLVVRELTKSQLYSNLIAKVKDLTKSVRISSIAIEKLMNMCEKGLI
jgi:cell division protein FtsL